MSAETDRANIVLAQAKIAVLRGELRKLDQRMRESTDRDDTLVIVGDMHRMENRIMHLNNYINAIEY